MAKAPSKTTGSAGPAKIALAFPRGVPHIERALRGIMDYAHQRTDWSFVFSPETHAMSVRQLDGWPGQGVIAMINTAADDKAARELGIPVVNISGALKTSSMPRVRVDYDAIGRLAADHLLDRGFRRFAFYGVRGLWYSQLYRDAFVQRVAEHEGECAVHESASTIGLKKPWQNGADQLAKWLRSLEPPVGLMACSDPRAVMVAEACHALGRNVPDEIAIIGSNNDTITCEFCDPPLTSIHRNGEKVGYTVASVLDRMLRGGPEPDGDIVIDPGEVIPRASTNVLSVDDEQLALAVQFVHDHIAEPFGVDHMVDAVGMSRRWLENAFARWIRRTPYQFINEQRVERVKKLLVGPERLSMKQIALRCGFTNSRRMKIVFERIVGASPRQYRDERKR